MNSEFELLDKRTDGYEYLVDYYFDTEDYENVKLTYQKIYKLLDQQVVEAKKIERLVLEINGWASKLLTLEEPSLMKDFIM